MKIEAAATNMKNMMKILVALVTPETFLSLPVPSGVGVFG
jgi:hypothetical protein